MKPPENESDSSDAVRSLSGQARSPKNLANYLAAIRQIAGADAIQLVRFSPAPTLIADCAPTAEISSNLLATAGNLPASVDGARCVVNSYRFGGRLVHLAASNCGNDEWLLAWVRLPEGGSPEQIVGIVELAAAALSAPVAAQGQPTLELPDVFTSLDASASRPRRLQQFCQWLTKTPGIASVYLARRGIVGWRVCAASTALPTSTSPLAHAITHALRGRSGASALEEIQRLSGQPSALVYSIDARHSLIVTGTRTVLPPPALEIASRLLPLLDPHATPVHTLQQRWRESPVLRRRFILIASLISVIVLLLPLHQRVRTDVILEPSVRRFIAAPFNGVVKKVHARAGDIVKPGQLLVELDGREIQERLSDVEARLASASLQNTTELESSNYGQAAVKALDAESLAHERDLLKYRQENLKLFSPMHGVIVTGELERAEGAAVELGKPLLEMAPLETLVAELSVDETDVALVRDSMETSIKLNALPGHSFSEKILKISPRSETRNGANIFVAEAEIANPDGLLRPGMKGRAVIFADRRPLIWLLIRKPWQMLQRWSFH